MRKASKSEGLPETFRFKEIIIYGTCLLSGWTPSTNMCEESVVKYSSVVSFWYSETGMCGIPLRFSKTLLQHIKCLQRDFKKYR